MLIRPNQQIDMANTLNTSVDKKVEKLQALNYSQVLLRVKFLRTLQVMRAAIAIRHNYSEYITLAPGKTSEASHASTIKCNMSEKCDLKKCN